MECARCGLPREPHSFYELVDGQLITVTVCRQCRQKEQKHAQSPKIRRAD